VRALFGVAPQLMELPTAPVRHRTCAWIGWRFRRMFRPIIRGFARVRSHRVLALSNDGPGPTIGHHQLRPGSQKHRRDDDRQAQSASKGLRNRHASRSPS